MRTNSYHWPSSLFSLLASVLIGLVSVSCSKNHLNTASPGPNKEERSPLSNPGDLKRETIISSETSAGAPSGAVAIQAPNQLPPRPTPTIVVKAGKIVQEWQAPPEAAEAVNPVKSNPEAAKIGREYYLQRCVDCHGKEGKGNGYLSKSLLKPPTNLASRMVQANSDAELFWKITNGKSPMPANRVRFTDEQRWYIVAYIRTFTP